MDYLLQSLGGCGLFQILVCTIISTSPTPSYWAFYFMAYGRYNPGWRCLDNVTSLNYSQIIDKNTSTKEYSSLQTENQTNVVYTQGSCELFDSCRHVEFNPEASTTTTEFGLICNRAWISSTIISILTCGCIFGLAIIGMIADKYGRKTTFHFALLIMAVLNILSIFSVSWQMYAAIDFFIGVTFSVASLNMILSTEFVPPKWRLLTSSVPNWSIAISFFSLTAMLTQDWKTLRIIIACLCGFYFILYFFLPRSLRWLAVNYRKGDLVKVVKMIAKLNRSKAPSEEVIKALCVNKDEKTKADSNVTTMSLFRKGFRLQTCILGISFLSLDTVYFALAYGISIMPGNLYENMIILASSEIPANIFSVVTGNLSGRRKGVMFFTFLQFLGLICVAVLDLTVEGEKQVIGKLVTIVFSKLCLNAGWYILATATLEMYPTIARSTINSFARMCTICGGLVGPALIPTDRNNPYLFIFYFVLAGITLLVCGLVFLLPETKGKSLMNTWSDRAEWEQQKPNKVI